MRVVLYQQDRASANGLREVLARRGFEVRTAGMFNDLAGWLMLYGEAALVARVLPTDVTPDEIATAVELTRESARPGDGHPVLDEEPE